MRNFAASVLASLVLAVPAWAVEPNDPLYPVQWALPRIGAPSAWDVTRGDGHLRVAILDTGCTGSLPDTPSYIRMEIGFDAVNGDADASDDHGHGTAVAGVVAARWGNAVGTAGLAPLVSVIPVKVLGATGSGTWKNLAAGIDWAVLKGARVILISASGASADPVEIAPVRNALDRAEAAGVLVVAAAGDSSGAIEYPARFANVLSVGAIDSSGLRAAFSAQGPELDLVAPGVLIRTTWTKDYRSQSGTAFAAAHVAAVAALYLSAVPGASLAEVRNRLLTSAEDLGPAGRDNQFGYGLVRADGAVK
jgi:subtilisin family serine protease